jgi:DNA-binding transcriptional ArsR family regulator
MVARGGVDPLGGIPRAARPPRSPVKSKAASHLPRPDVDSYSRVLWWLFSSSAGARTRGRVIVALRAEPKNAQQLATELAVDYTTVRHHLKVLLENSVIESTGPHYGQVYSLAATAEARWAELDSILRRHRGTGERR